MALLQVKYKVCYAARYAFSGISPMDRVYAAFSLRTDCGAFSIVPKHLRAYSPSSASRSQRAGHIC
jgi:hypothetical protein